MPRKLVLITAALLIPVAALAAPRGKPGLWNITSKMEMPNMPQMSPEMMAMMKQRGIKVPQSGQPITNQICMTAEQAAMDHPPNMDREGVKCTPHVLSQTATSATTEIICHGTMEGTGRSQISWRGDSHYEGSYSFTGSVGGRPNNMSSSYTGDWVKTDCGSVKAYSGRPMPSTRPPAPQ